MSAAVDPPRRASDDRSVPRSRDPCLFEVGLNPRRIALIVAAGAVLPAGCARPEPGPSFGRVAQADTDVCPPQTVEGVDVDDRAGAIEWPTLAGSGRAFAFVLATQGDYAVQSTFAYNWAATKAAGVRRGATHFFDPTVDGNDQAEYFLSALGPAEAGDLPAAVELACPTAPVAGDAAPDCEHGASADGPADSGWASAGVITERLLDWLTAVEGVTGRKPIIFTNNYWFNASGVDDKALAGYPLFVSWATQTACFTVGLGNSYTSAAFWQWETTAQAPGVSGTVGLDRFAGTLDQLVALTKAATPAQCGCYDGDRPSRYCGEAVGGYARRSGNYCSVPAVVVANPGDLFTCEGSVWSVGTHCPYGCTVTDDPTNDACKASAAGGAGRAGAGGAVTEGTTGVAGGAGKGGVAGARAMVDDDGPPFANGSACASVGRNPSGQGLGGAMAGVLFAASALRRRRARLASAATPC